MRAGAVTLQHTLTTEAASVLKHSLSLARRRGHAQVTPLHVATILLSSRTSLLRRACLKSHAQTTSHPLLHSRALELCFSVALNRLPATPGLLHGQPCISNALVAALKRAQSHQRRGCVEQQQLLQQPLLAVKVELEQLVLSILDDPSVSRVMREAGFSSSLAKDNLEDSASVSPVSQYCYNSSSGGVYSTPCSPKSAAVSVPSGGLGLSLNATSGHEPRVASTHNLFQLLDRKSCITKEEQDRLACCAECTTNYEKEVSMFKSNQQHQLSWILPQGSESLQRDNLTELRRKWSRLCHSIHRGRHIWNHLDSSLLNHQSYMGKNSYTSSYLGWPNQNGASPSNNSIYSMQTYNHSASSVPRFRRQQSCHIDFEFSEKNQKHQVEEPNLVSLKSREGKEVRVTLALSNTLSSDSREGERKTLDEGETRKLLQENVPWQSERIPSIVQVMIQNSTSIKNKNTWLLINGNDSVGKRRLALAIAEAVFGSAKSLLCMNMRKRDNKLNQCSKMLERTLRNCKNIVVLLEDIDYADAEFINFIGKGLKTGNLGESSEGGCSETIFILTKGDPRQYLDDDDDITTSVIQMKLRLNGITPKSDQKRKAECELYSQKKTARISEKGADATLEEQISKKVLPRQFSSKILDLNVMANDDCDDQPEGEYSPISSDVTFETSNDSHNSLGFLDLIENQFIFNQENEKMKESFLSKFRRSFEIVDESTEIMLFDHHVLPIDEEVLEALSVRCGMFLDSLFDEWLKDVFHTSLKTTKTGGKEAAHSVRLCFEGKKSCMEDGFMCSNLPKKID